MIKISGYLHFSSLWLCGSLAKLIYISAVLCCLLSGCSRSDVQSGRVYYVDSVTGDDTRIGTTPESAWKSLSKVNATTFSPGDKILFKSGSSWTGQLWPKGSGREGAPITIDKYGDGPKPVIAGAGLAEDAVLLKNQDYWEVQNLEITNKGAGAAKRRGVHVASHDYGDMRHIYLRSLTIHDVNGIDSEKVNGGIHYTSQGDSKPSRFIDLRIENNLIYRVDRSGIFGWSSHWVRAKWHPSLDVIIRGNRLDDIGGDGIVVVATDGAIVEHNVVSKANQRSEGYNVAIWAWSADNTIIQFNEAYLTKGERDGEGFDSDWNSRNTIIQYNYSHDNEGGFLLICNEGGHTPDSNIGNIGTIVRYNISQNDRNRGINIAGPVTNTKIYNNTIYVGKGMKVDLVLHSDWHGWADDTSFYNNIFYVEGEGQFGHAISRKDNGHHITAPGYGRSKNNLFDSNVYYGIVKPTADRDGWNGDPMLIGAGAAGNGRETASVYGLSPGSPVIDTGRPVGEDLTKDFLGSPVPSCAGLDPGAVESVQCVQNTGKE
jgi:Right handed beta helix region